MAEDPHAPPRKGPRTGDFVYSIVEHPAKVVKSLIQIAIALWVLYQLGRQFYWSQSHPSCVQGAGRFCYAVPQSADILNLTGDALAAAAAVELVYTLFMRGPDEALDPLMLGLSAAALLSLGAVDKFNIKEGVALFLYTLALSVLFLIRKHLAQKSLSEASATNRQGSEQ